LKASRDCILVISDGRLFQSLMVDGKKEFLLELTLMNGTRNLIAFALVLKPVGIRTLL
jgi:hypothetical protein